MTAQAKRRLSVITIYASVAAIVGLLGYICKAQDFAYNIAIRPNVELTVGKVISDSIAPCKAQMKKIDAKQCLNDSNVDIIKSILEVMATNDELIKAKERRSNPTGIH